MLLLCLFPVFALLWLLVADRLGLVHDEPLYAQEVEPSGFAPQAASLLYHSG